MLERAEYAQVTKMLGNGKVEAMCFDGEKRLAHIRGKMRKKVSSVRILARSLSFDARVVEMGSTDAMTWYAGLDQPG